jgi:Generalcontrol nonderepressible 1 (Gcn1) N-terminal
MNGAVRTAAIEFFGALVAKLSGTSEAQVVATNEILALPKASKTTGAEHRAALYAMLSFIKPSSVVSPIIAFTLPDLLAKESSEAAMQSLHIQLAKHFAFVLQHDISVPAPVTALFVKETASQKALVRRAFFQALGDCFWILRQALEESNQSWPLEAEKLVFSLLHTLESNIKTLGSSPLNAPIGPLEGYIAISLSFRSPSPTPSGS